MKPASVILSLLLLSSAAAAEPVFLIASVGNLRKAPDGELVDKLPINTRLFRLGTKGDWSAVERTVDGRVVRGFLASSLLATEPLTMKAALNGWRDSETAAARRSWAERAMALDADDPRALAAYVAALRAVGDEAKLHHVLAVVDKRYRQLTGERATSFRSRPDDETLAAARALYAVIPDVLADKGTGAIATNKDSDARDDPLTGLARYASIKPSQAIGLWRQRLKEGDADRTAFALEYILVRYDPEAVLAATVPRDDGRIFPSRLGRPETSSK